DYDRNIVVGAFSTKAHGGSQGWQIGSSLGGGYDFNVDNGGKTGVMRNVTVGPFAQLQYQYAHLAGFTESGAGTASLSVGSQGVHSLSLKVGGRVAGEIESHLGNFIPSLSVAYEREFLNGARSVDTNFVGGTAAPFATPVDAAQKNFAVIGVGLTKALDDGFTVGLTYGGRFNLKDKQHAVSLRGKYDF
nr:autotransporter outer membrane beta-barrel domain-containing protein [Alphaproteobacteria bacterium]